MLGKGVFSSNDFDCKCNRPNCFYTIVNDELVLALEALVKDIGEIIIDSGFRCKEHNKEVGGLPDSQHLLGNAADIRSWKFSPKYIANRVENIFLFEHGGVGLYRTFLHADVRKGRARWDKSGE